MIERLLAGVFALSMVMFSTAGYALKEKTGLSICCRWES
jgi:hypothetical protein